MAHEQEEAPGRNRLLPLGAVALLVAATAVAFGRVFTGHLPTLKLLLAGLASLAVAAALARRSPIVAALASCVGLLFAVSYLVFPDTLWYGIPAGRTFHAIALAIQQVGEQTRVQVAPTVPLRPLLMAAITALWTAAFSSHALALRSGSPLLAAVPCAALLAFAGVVMKDGPRRGYAALFLIGVMAVLFVDGLRRVRQWGPLRPWRAFGKPTIAGAASTRGARRVTFAAVAVALLLPGLLPGFRSSPWLDAIGKGGGGHEVDPLVSITANLKRGRPIKLFSVDASQGVYWRWMGLDRFDGNTWTTDDLDLDKGTVVVPGQQLPQLPIQPNPAVTDVRTLTQEVHIISSPGRWLPMAYSPQSITVSSGSIRYDPSIVAAQPTSGVHPGLTYSVTSLIAEPTFSELHRSFDFAPFRQYLQLPAQTKADVLPIVSGVLQRAGNPSDPIGQILAIQTWFTDTGGFSYSTSVSGEADTQALLTFLSRTRRGFCQQFAGAMAVMLRAIGIPARVAVGFAQGHLDPQTHTWTVTTADAHSWVEVPLPGFGWVPFEPTPTRTNVITQGIVASSDRNSEGGGTPTGGPSNGAGTQRDNNRPGDFVGRGANPRSLSRDPSRGSGQILTTRSYGPLVILALAILLVLGAIGIPLWKVAWRRRQLRRARSPRELSLAAYRVFASRAADVGFGRWPGETLPEYRARLRRELRSPNGDLDRLTQIVAAAAYRPQSPTREEAREAVRSGRSAIAAVNRDVPPLRRLAGVLRPRIED